jgi:hypothetical protein
MNEEMNMSEMNEETSIATEPLFSILPVEIRTTIYEKCEKQDLKSLTMCNRWLRDDVNPTLWKEITVNSETLEDSTIHSTMMLIKEKFCENSTLMLIKEKFRNTQLTSKLIFRGSYPKSLERVFFGFAFLLESCNPEVLKSLEILNFLPSSGLRLISELFVNLSSLYLSSIESADWDYIPKLHGLKKLRLWSCNIGKKDVEAICTMEQLEILKIRGCPSDHFENLKDFSLKNLITLELDLALDEDEPVNYPICNIFQYAIYSIISPICTKLDGLVVSQGVTDVGVACVSHLSTLTKVVLEYCDNITDNSLVHLSKLPNLRQLCVSGDRLTSACLQQIGGMKTLICLDMTIDDATDFDFTHIQHLLSLRALAIEGMSTLTNASLEAVSKLVCLAQLNIHSCTGFTDEGLVHLTKLPRLKSLVCNVDDGEDEDKDSDDDDDDDESERMKITTEGLDLHGLSKFLVDDFYCS